jgi:phage gp36-like protein
MPNYTTRAALGAIIPPQFVLQALDDDGDGVEDAGLFDQVLANAQQEVDGILGKRYATPFASPIPNLVGNATLIFVGEALYTRRGYGDEARPNPFAERAKDIRKQLVAISNGEGALSPDLDRKKPSASVITEPAKTSSATGRTTV